MIKGIMSESLHIKGIMSKEFSAIRCLDFNGSTDYVEVPDDASLNIVDTITIETWVKWNTIPTEGTYQPYFEKLQNYNNRLDFGIINDTLHMAYSNGITSSDNAIDNVSLYISSGELAHIIFVADPSFGSKVYINLIERRTNPFIGSFIIDANLILGKRSTNYFNGSIYVVRIYKNKALNTTERQNNFNGKITQDGLVAEWLMREQKGNIVHDTSENSNTGTIYGADWYEKIFNTPLKGIMSNSSEIKGIMTAEYI